MSNDMPEWVPAWRIMEQYGLSVENIEDALKARLPEKIFRVPEFWDKWTDEFWLKRYPAKQVDESWRQKAVQDRDELLTLDSKEVFDKLGDLLCSALPISNVFTSDNLNVRLGNFAIDALQIIYRGKKTDTICAALRSVPRWALPQLYNKYGIDNNNYEVNTWNIHDIFFNILKHIFIESLLILQSEISSISAFDRHYVSNAEQSNQDSFIQQIYGSELTLSNFIIKGRISGNGDGVARVKATINENKEALEYANQQLQKGRCETDIYKELKDKGGSLAVIGCLLKPHSANCKSALSHGKYLHTKWKKTQGKQAQVVAKK